MTTLRIETGGIHLSADELGPRGAPTVILGHGGGQTRHSWSKAGEELAAAGYHVLNYDLLGHGESDWEPSGDYSLRRRADDLRAVSRHAHPRFALVGASLGGATALAAATLGMDPAAIVLVDIVPKMHMAGAGRIRAFMTGNPDGFATLEEAADAIAAYNPERPRPSSLDGLRKNLREGPDGRFRWHWDPRMMNGQMDEGFMLRVMDEADWTDRIPTLLVRGLKSDIVTDEGVDDLRRRIPDLEVVDIKGAGHMVAGDRNDHFNAAVLEFLSRVMPPR